MMHRKVRRTRPRTVFIEIVVRNIQRSSEEVKDHDNDLQTLQTIVELLAPTERSASC